jgi:sugar lactone lactonase YvrE
VYVADSFNDTIRKISPTAMVSTFAGAGGAVGSVDGSGSAALFANPNLLAFDPAGILYVSDGYNNAIRKITPAGVVSTFVGAATQSGSADGSGSSARFNVPHAVAADAAGTLYVADSYNSTIRKITAAGAVSTLAGLAGKSGTLDGSGGNARFNFPYGVAVDSEGNVYVADSFNEEIRKITPAGVVSTLAGNGTIGSADGKGSAASFHYPYGLAVDSAGILYVADTYNHTIRKITPDGTVSTLAGTAGKMGSTDATGAAAGFNLPMSIAIDSTGNLYVADSSNNAIRKIAPGAVVTTLAGNAGQTGSIDGTGSAARFSTPNYLTLDSAGNVYVSDTGNSTIRKITSSGVVTTVIGTPGAVGVQLGPLPGSINVPYGLAVLPGAGVTLAVADGEENVILRITLQ